MKPPLFLRHAHKNDYNFIYNSWLKQIEGSYSTFGISKKVFYSIYPNVITDLLKSSKTIVAVDSTDHEHIYGYITFFPHYEGNNIILHFVFVKSSFRRWGIANALKQAAIDLENEQMKSPKLYSTHSTTRPGNKDVLTTKWDLIYNPYLIWKDVYGIIYPRSA